MTEPLREPTFPPTAPTAALGAPGAGEVEVDLVLGPPGELTMLARTVLPLGVCGATVMAWLAVTAAPTGLFQ